MSGSSPPSRATEPSASTTSSASTWVGGHARTRGSADRRRWWRRCRRWCTPAATTGRARSAGRGGATSRLRSRLSTPGSTHATCSSASTSSTRLSRVVTMTSGSSTGVAPPARPVPLPRATNGRSWRAATRTAVGDLVARRGGSTRPRRDHGRHPRRARTARARAARRARRSGPSADCRSARSARVSSMWTRDYDRPSLYARDRWATHARPTAPVPRARVGDASPTRSTRDAPGRST